MKDYLLAVLIVIGLLPKIAFSQQAILSGRSPIAGPLETIQDDWTVVLQSNDRLQRISYDELVCWGTASTRAEYHRIVLRDGSIIHADVQSISGTSVKFNSRLWQRQTLPLNEVAAIVFDVKLDLFERTRDLEDISNLNLDSESVVWLTNGDQLEAIVESISPRRSGPDSKRSRRVAKFDTGGRELELPFTSVKAIKFSNLNRSARKRAKATIGFHDGSIVNLMKLEQEDDQLELRTSGGSLLVATADFRSVWSSVSLVQTYSQYVTFLSDLDSVRESSFGMFDSRFPMKPDHCTTGGPLLNQRSITLKGLGMHATGNAVFEVSDGVRRFAAEIAIDGRAGTGGSVICKVYLLSDKKWELEYTSEMIRGGQPPVPVSIDVKGKTAIALVVEQGEQGDVLDRANWLNARFESNQPE